MTDSQVCKQRQMDVQINQPQADDVTSVRVDGALADDERTETERSPEVKVKRMKTMSTTQELNMTSPEVKVSGSDPDKRSADLPGLDTGDSNVDGIGDNNVNSSSSHNKSGKRRNRRKGKGGKHHCKKWKPYTKLSWEEKRIQDERESRRATQRREQRFASGQPMAPYNTTQFLMEQHEGEDQDRIEGSNNNPQGTNNHLSNPDRSVPVVAAGRTAPLHSISVSGEASGSVDSSEEYYSSPDDEEMFLQRDFSEEYDNFHAERLQAMSKDELVREYLELEGKIEKLEKKGVKDANKDSNPSPNSSNTITRTLDHSGSVGMTSGRLQEELQKLKAENELLKKENDILRAGMLNNVTFDDKENQPRSWWWGSFYFFSSWRKKAEHSGVMWCFIVGGWGWGTVKRTDF